MMGPTDHDLGFFIWSAVGFLLAFGIVASASIGLPFLLIGLMLFVVLLLKGPTWPTDLGLLAGIGALCILIAIINLISGDLSPTVWLAVGVSLVASSAGLFWSLRCRPGAAGHSATRG